MTLSDARAAMAAREWSAALEILSGLTEPERLRMASVCHTELEQLDEALICAQRAVFANPTNAAAWYQLAIVHHVMVGDGPNHYLEAHVCFERAYTMAPDNPSTASGLAASAYAMGQPELALKLFQKAQEIVPHTLSAVAESGVLKLLGRYEEGWTKDEARMDLTTGVRTPRYEGTLADLRDRTVVVRAEQGFGDMIELMRYVPKLKLYCREVIFEVHEGMEAMCAAFTQTKAVTAPYLFDPFSAASVNLMSLPMLLGPVIGWDPLSPLSVPGQFLFPRKGIGICHASMLHEIRPDSVYLNSICRSKTAPWDLVVELAKLYGPFRSLMHQDLETNDWYETACVIASLELVISVDTAVAHLAASLGIETWLLQRFDHCWRWNPGWYGKNVRIFKQKAPGDWESVFRQVREAFATRNT